jgi:hypothetical protein
MKKRITSLILIFLILLSFEATLFSVNAQAIKWTCIFKQKSLRNLTQNQVVIWTFSVI